MRKNTPLEEAIYDWLKDTLEIANPTAEVIFTDQNGTIPAGPFIAIALRSAVADGRTETRAEGIPGSDFIQEVIIYRAQVSFTLRFFMPESEETAQEVKARLWSNRALEDMSRNNIGIKKVGDTRDASYIEEGSSNKQRTDLDIEIHYSSIYEDLIGTIGHVPIVGKVDGEVIVDIVVDEP